MNRHPFISLLIFVTLFGLPLISATADTSAWTGPDDGNFDATGNLFFARGLGALRMMISAPAETVTWNRSAYGQEQTSPCPGGGMFNWPNNNNWSQALDVECCDISCVQTFIQAPSNWSTDSYPAGAGVDVLLGDGGVGGQNAPTNLDKSVRTDDTPGLMVLDSLTIAPSGGLNVEFGVNLTANLIDLQGNNSDDAAITLNGGGGSSVINITSGGTLKKSAGTKTYSINPDLPVIAANATIAATAGTLGLPAFGSTYTDDTFAIGTGAVIDLIAQDPSCGVCEAFFNGTFTASGAGTLRLSGGLLSPQSNTVFNFPGSVWQWVGGLIGGRSDRTFTNAGRCTMAGPVGLEGQGSVFYNSGTVIQSGAGMMTLPYNSGFVNNASSVYDLQNDLGLTLGGGGGGGPFFQNAGTIEKTAGTRTSLFYGVVLTNTGTLRAASGTIQFGETYTQDSGSTSLDGGNLTFDRQGIFNGGTLVGSGTINGTVTNNGAEIGPGFSPGTITINGDYTQGADGIMTMEIGGAASGASYDQLQVTGTASLGGTLNIKLIDGFLPKVGDVYTLISAGAFGGSFSNVAIAGFTGQIDVSSNGLTLTVAASPPQALNISTRLNVLTDDNVLIGGFIVSGTEPKKVIVRAIGPSLGGVGIAGALPDTTLELHDGAGAIIASNDNWRDDQETEIVATTIPPTDDLESAIVASLDPGAYTAIVRGKNNTTGVALVEAYDLDQAASSHLANISTRGFVDIGENVMIGGFIIGGGTAGTSTNVLVRGIGPSLTGAGITNPLADPLLELHDGNGNLLMSNDNWRDTQEAEIIATTVSPTDDLESAILADLTPGAYTAILRGKNDTAGVALVEAYNLQ